MFFELHKIQLVWFAVKQYSITRQCTGGRGVGCSRGRESDKHSVYGKGEERGPLSISCADGNKICYACPPFPPLLSIPLSLFMHNACMHIPSLLLGLQQQF